MRVSRLATLPVLAALALAPQQAPAQVSVNIHLGTPLVVTDYSSSAYGDWHTSYHKWRPTTVYVYDGHYYNHSVKGARQVQIYRNGNQYFLPPRDADWAKGADKRFNYKRRPNDDDYTHVDHRP